MWKAEVDGRVLHFELTGINNQNFLMRDRETGSWWQQVTGRAIRGPFAGRQLELAPWDEVSFAIWRREHPGGLALEPDAEYAHLYRSPDWDEDVKEIPTVVEVDPAAGLHPRELVVGVEAGGRAKAYPLAELAKNSPVADQLGDTPIILVVERDGKSVRCFDRRVEGETLDLYRMSDESDKSDESDESDSFRLVDAQTGSLWDFSGKAVEGPLAGRDLTRVRTLKDFWFDWQHYHPETEVFSAGLKGL